MEKAKQAIRDFTSKSGHHDTTVHSATAPSVEHEAVKPQQHENINTAIDREVHQDHYHQTVQPVEAQEVLPEQHHHKLGGVEHREFDHRNNEETRRRLAAETEGFHDERVVHDTTRTKAHAPVVEGEHVHHHLHETIQPVVHKETIEPHVVHTTVPIHETHHNKAQHHQTTTLPAVNMSDWQSQGGLLHGRDERYDNFEGQPEDVGGLDKVLRRSHESDKDPVERHTFHGDFNEEGGREGHHAKQYSGRTGAGAGDNMTSSSTTTGTGSRMGMGTSSTSKMGTTTGGTTTSSTGRTAMVDEGMTGSRNPMSSGASTTSRESGVTGSTGGAAASAAAMAMRGNRDNTTTGTTGTSGTTQSGRMAGSSAPSGLGPLAGRTTGGSGTTSGMTGNMPAASDMGSTTTSSTTGGAGTGTGARHVRADSGKGFTDEDTYGSARKPGAFDSTRVGERGDKMDKMAPSHDETGRKKSGLLDRLNPLTDSTGDGQAGFMK